MKVLIALLLTTVMAIAQTPDSAPNYLKTIAYLKEEADNLKEKADDLTTQLYDKDRELAAAKAEIEELKARLAIAQSQELKEFRYNQALKESGRTVIYVEKP